MVCTFECWSRTSCQWTEDQTAAGEANRMNLASPLHDALDQLLALAEQQGFPATEYLGAGAEPARIRRQLEELGLTPIQELVDFLSWRRVIHPRGSAPLFWETEYWSFEIMLQ